MNVWRSCPGARQGRRRLQPPVGLDDRLVVDIEADRAILRADGSIGSRIWGAPWGTVTISLDTKVNSLDAVSENGVGVFVVNQGPLYFRHVEARRAEAPPGIDGVTPKVATVPPPAGVFSPDTTALTAPAGRHNPLGRPCDVNGDGLTSPLDVLLIINRLNQVGTREAPSHSTADEERIFGDFDVNEDGFVTAIDVLWVINELNRGKAGLGLRALAE